MVKKFFTLPYILVFILFPNLWGGDPVNPNATGFEQTDIGRNIKALRNVPAKGLVIDQIYQITSVTSNGQYASTTSGGSNINYEHIGDQWEFHITTPNVDGFPPDAVGKKIVFLDAGVAESKGYTMYELAEIFEIDPTNPKRAILFNGEKIHIQFKDQYWAFYNIIYDDSYIGKEILVLNDFVNNVGQVYKDHVYTVTSVPQDLNGMFLYAGGSRFHWSYDDQFGGDKFTVRDANYGIVSYSHLEQHERTKYLVARVDLNKTAYTPIGGDLVHGYNLQLGVIVQYDCHAVFNGTPFNSSSPIPDGFPFPQNGTIRMGASMPSVVAHNIPRQWKDGDAIISFQGINHIETRLARSWTGTGGTQGPVWNFTSFPWVINPTVDFGVTNINDDQYDTLKFASYQDSVNDDPTPPFISFGILSHFEVVFLTETPNGYQEIFTRNFDTFLDLNFVPNIENATIQDIIQ